MGYKINLIPPELSVAGKTNRLVGNMNKISTGVAGLSVFVAVVFLGFFLYFSNEYKKSNTTSEGLKKQINSLAQSEQRLIFAKDRLNKITEVQQQENAAKEISVYNLLYQFLASRQDMSVVDVSIDSGKMEISIFSSALSSIKSFFAYLDQNKEEFNKVTVSTFSYSPSSGYVLSLVFAEK